MDLFDKMEMPIRCPLCNDILVNEYAAGGYLFKHCETKLNHKFGCGGRPWEEPKISIINISVGKCRELSIYWNLMTKKMSVNKTPPTSPQIMDPNKWIELPFVEINLNEPYKAINKVKVLLPFA